jgi:tRNA(adenine34) deaminase
MNTSAERSGDEYFMRKALELAARALRGGELPIGAIVVMNQDVIASAYCADKRDKRLAHAELLALGKADARSPTPVARRTMTLYTNLEPCVMCLGAAMSFGIGRIVFATDAPADGAVTRLSGIPFGNSSYADYQMPHIVGGVLQDDSRSLFQAFVGQSRDRTMVSFARGVARPA